MDHSGGSLRGYVHFGPGPFGPNNVGTDILDDMGGPAGPGAYTVWMQQAGSPATYRMDFVVTPEPAGLALFGLAGIAFATGARRRCVS